MRTRRRGPETGALSDRFIPSRRGINLQDSFALLPDSQTKKRDTPQEGAKDDNLDTYTMLLRSEFLGSEPIGGRRSDDFAPTSPQRNLFRFRALPSTRAEENAAYALSPVGSDSQRVLCSPRKAPRKISTVPYKVLDAPALQDDFYLNLVDWSSLNVLAVGLGTCVYLWSACTSKVTKLCDLGPEDSVRRVAPALAHRLCPRTARLRLRPNATSMVRLLGSSPERARALSYRSLRSAGRSEGRILRSAPASARCRFGTRRSARRHGR